MPESDMVRSIEHPELHRPRFIVSRAQGVVAVALGYVVVVSSASLLLRLVEATQGYDDRRNIDAALIFAAVLAIPFGRALYNVARRTRFPALNAAPQQDPAR